MQGHDARILRGAALPTAATGTVAAIAAFALKGVAGLIGAAIGTALVMAFFAVSFVVVTWAAARKPALMFPVAMGSFVVKILVLGLLLYRFGGTTVLDATAFALTAAVCVAVWLGGHMRALATDRRPSVEPAQPSAADPSAAEHAGDAP